MQTTKSTIAVDRVKASRLESVDFSNLPFGSIFSDHMLVTEYAGGAWREPRIVPYGPLPLSPAASALHYGQAVFEGLKAFRQADDGIALFRARDNFVRCNRSTKRLAMPAIPEDVFVDGTAELVRLDHRWVPRNPGASLYIRPVCFATEETLAVRPSSTYLFVVLTCPVGPYFADPLRLIVEERYVRAFPKGTGAIKAAGNYAGSLVAQRLAQEQGFHSVVWLDGPNGRFVEESGLMNVCFVIDGAVVTPPLGGTILPGVTRDSALVLLRDMNIEVVERPIAIDEVLRAGKTGELSEAFALGTAAAVAPIESIRYRDDDLRLNVQLDRSIAAKLRTRLEGIRTGREPDRYGWLTRL